MKKQLYKTITLNKANEDELTTNMTLLYYKVENGKTYGVEIVKENKNNFFINLEKSLIHNLKEKESEIEDLLNKLVKLKVTPITFEYIIEDLKYSRNI